VHSPSFIAVLESQLSEINRTLAQPRTRPAKITLERLHVRRDAILHCLAVIREVSPSPPLTIVDFVRRPATCPNNPGMYLVHSRPHLSTHSDRCRRSQSLSMESLTPARTRR
jgi:hypothetical protein